MIMLLYFFICLLLCLLNYIHECCWFLCIYVWNAFWHKMPSFSFFLLFIILPHPLKYKTTITSLKLTLIMRLFTADCEKSVAFIDPSHACVCMFMFVLDCQSVSEWACTEKRGRMYDYFSYYSFSSSMNWHFHSVNNEFINEFMRLLIKHLCKPVNIFCVPISSFDC